MRREVALALLLRYALAYAGGTTVVAYWAAGGQGGSVPVAGLLLASVGLVFVVTALTGITGTGAAAPAVEPASGYHIDPLDFVRVPNASNQLKALAFGAGLLGFGTVLFLGLV